MTLLKTSMGFMVCFMLAAGCAENDDAVVVEGNQEALEIPGVDTFSTLDAEVPERFVDAQELETDPAEDTIAPEMPDTIADIASDIEFGETDITADVFDALNDAESENEDVVPDAGGDDALSDDVAEENDAELDVFTGEPDVVVEEGWRSSLYPADWAPGFSDSEGRFLHDFSYAGYRNGEEPLPTVSLESVFDVVQDFGADETGESDSTASIQSAIDAAAAAGGGVVFFPEGLFRLDGKLLITASNVVLKGVSSEESKLFFSLSNGMAYLGHIRFLGSPAMGQDIPLVADGDAGSFEVFVEDATALEVGQDIVIGWVITDAFIEAHDMTGTWEAFNGTWQPFFQREVVSIDTESTPHRVQIDVPLRYRSFVSDAASIRVQEGLLSEVGLEDLGLSNVVSWDDAWAQNQVHVLSMENVKDAWIRKVKSFSSPLAPTSGNGEGAHLQSSGILVKLAKRVSVVESVLENAENIGSGGNGYLFEVRQSDEVLFRDCIAKNGRHNFIQNWGFGTTGCVWLRVESEGGTSGVSKTFPFGLTGYSEMHHSLATANLIDSSTFDDGFSIINRGSYSSGAGHTGTENVFWNTSGSGLLRSQQFGWGYVIGTSLQLEVELESGLFSGSSGPPTDFMEGYEEGADLTPSSLYEDQLERRLSFTP